MRLSILDRKVEPLIQTAFNELNADISPDGRWLAYQSDESGVPEIYVRPFPDVNAGRWQVSTGGGRTPAWNRNGRELYYRNGTMLMLVSVAGKETLEPKTPVVLYSDMHDLRSDTGLSYAVDSKGRGFLMVRLSEENTTSSIVVMLNWFDELRRLMAGR